MSTRNLSLPAQRRNPADYRTLTEALHQAHADSGQTQDTTAEQLGVRRAYLADALSVGRAEVLQFQARHLVPFMRATHSALPLAWLAHSLGYVLVPLETAQTAQDLTREVLDVQEHLGVLSARVRRALSNGLITAHERSDIKEDARRVQRESAEVERAVDNLPTVIGGRR